MTTEERKAFIEEHGEAGEAYLAYNGGDANLDDFEEAYAGEFLSDEDFAQDMAESIGEIPNAGSAAWPLYCIDWEFAARELMHDYYKENGHYFRAL